MSKVKDGILGLCLGDALGVPVEFKHRDTIANNPVVDMIGYGTYHLPPGSWSDDSTMTFCLLESLATRKKVDLDDLSNRFAKWLFEGYWTPYGEVFDIGNATKAAIIRVRKDKISPLLAGDSDLSSNGNGSLMRILPMAFFMREASLEDRMKAVADVSSVTHRHPISIIACQFYVEIAVYLLEGHSLDEALAGTRAVILERYRTEPHMKPFDRLLFGDFRLLGESDIASSGYVIHTLEASIWCLLTTRSYREAVMKAINLGEDTDTTGAVTGGLAGIYYGLEAMPNEWIDSLARIKDINELCARFESGLIE
ncbi:ADP-ribosylglycohydrolase family protein [Paenibacillus sp. YIM B09110]|uniref:ADP-ribosylglycohydrolase family protein n=1 Tax=Paenibacillus sp. YIM B09110 TaxID=3126102 RepID=UPI00301C4246